MTDPWASMGQPYPQQPQPYGGGYGQPQPAQSTEPPFEAADFFKRSGSADSGPSAPSFKFENVVNSGVMGSIVAQRVVAKTKPGRTPNDPPTPHLDKNGKQLYQLAVTLQTSLRGWERVARVPSDDAGNPMPPEGDTGLRVIYLWYTLRDAVEQAIRVAGHDPALGLQIGATIGAKVVRVDNFNTDQPKIRHYDAIYRPASAQSAPAAAPAQPAPQAPQQPYPAQAPQQPWGPPPTAQQPYPQQPAQSYPQQPAAAQPYPDEPPF